MRSDSKNITGTFFLDLLQEVEFCPNVILYLINQTNSILQEAPGRISFTLDAWTSTTQVPFLGITAHWITTDWEMKSIIIDFVHLLGPHSGRNLADAFYKVLKDYGILTKVCIFNYIKNYLKIRKLTCYFLKQILGVATDNASNNNTMFEYFADLCAGDGVKFNPLNQCVRCSDSG